MSDMQLFREAFNDFAYAHEIAQELTYHEEAKVTPSYREKFCIASKREREAYAIKMADLPTESEISASTYVDDKIAANTSWVSVPAYDIYNALVGDILDAQKKNPEATVEQIDRIHHYIKEQSKSFELEDRVALARVIHEDLGDAIAGFSNSGEVLRPLVRDFVIPPLRETYELFLAESKQCKFTGEAAQLRDEALKEMLKSIDKLSQQLRTVPEVKQGWAH